MQTLYFGLDGMKSLQRCRRAVSSLLLSVGSANRCDRRSSAALSLCKRIPSTSSRPAAVSRPALIKEPQQQSADGRLPLHTVTVKNEPRVRCNKKMCFYLNFMYEYRVSNSRRPPLRPWKLQSLLINFLKGELFLTFLYYSKYVHTCNQNSLNGCHFP